MNKYIGKVCPFCKCEFGQEDEIVLCSACDMPHHKTCWIENQGCTTFGCLGTIRNVDDRKNTVTEREMEYEDTPRQNPEHVFCTRCGARNTASFSFCSKCGNKLENTAQRQIPPVFPNASAYAGYVQNQGIDPDIVALIRTNTQYYVPKFQKMKYQNKKVSWNWAAFFLAPYWFIYRKMYGYGIAVLAGSFFPILSATSAVPVILLAAYIVIGLFGNHLYLGELENRARRAKAWGEPYRSQFIYQKGGGSPLAAVLAVLGFSILNAMFTYYYMMI